MFCKKCGAKLKPNAKFCSKCGCSVLLPSNAEEVKPKDKKKLIALIVVLLLVVGAAVGTAVYLNSDTHHYKKNMKIANACYEEGNYREALEAYNAALKIYKDSEEAIEGKIAAYIGQGEQLYSKEDYEGALDAYIALLALQEDNADVYLWMSNAYIRLEKFEQAVTILQDGYQATKDKSLKTREEYLMDNIVPVKSDVLFSDREDGEWKQSYKYIYNYNDSGKLSREELYTYYDNGDMTENITVYDNEGRIVEEIKEEYSDDECTSKSGDVYFRDSNGTELYQLSYSDNTEVNYENGRIVKVSYARADVSDTILTYDDKEKLVNVVSDLNQYTFSYDDQGKVLSRFGYFISNSTRRDNTTYSYDDQERLIKMTVYYDDEEEPYSETVYKYDSSGNLILEEYTESPPSPFHTVKEWEYDSDGRLIVDNYYSNTGTSNWHEITYSYDMEGNKTEKYVTGDYESETTYTYDMFGNAIYQTYEKLSYINNSKERTIVYVKLDHSYAFIGDLGDGIDNRYAGASEDEEVVTKADKVDSGEAVPADEAETLDSAEADFAYETEYSTDEVSDIAGVEEAEEAEATEAVAEEDDNDKPVLNIVVEDEVKQIREWFYGTQNNLDNYEQSTLGNVTSYLEDGNPVKIIVKKGTDGWEYTREYYYHNGEFYFAFIYNGDDEHRLYFKEGQMIRYIDQDKNTYDYGQTGQFFDWETPALQEAYRLSEAGRN